MDKGCPILRLAYILKKNTDSEVSVKEARCMGTYCMFYEFCSDPLKFTIIKTKE